jgi:DNA-binding Lrp family transcriptional regulator
LDQLNKFICRTINAQVCAGECLDILKEIERKMLSELIKNSRRSDRELAKAIGSSQPTATRIRTKLEKEGYIKEYTAIPNLYKMGFSILAMTFVKLDVKSTLPADFPEFKKIHYEAMSKNPSAIMLVKRGMGLGYDAVMLSLHQDYGSLDKFRTFIRQNMSDRVLGIETFLVNMEEEQNSLPFSFNLLAAQVSLPSNKEPN